MIRRLLDDTWRVFQDYVLLLSLLIAVVGLVHAADDERWTGGRLRGRRATGPAATSAPWTGSARTSGLVGVRLHRTGTHRQIPTAAPCYQPKRGGAHPEAMDTLASVSGCQHDPAA